MSDPVPPPPSTPATKAPKAPSGSQPGAEANAGAAGVVGAAQTAAQTAAQNAAKSAADAIGLKGEHISAFKDFTKDPKGFIVRVVPSKVSSFLGTVVSLYAALVLQNCQAEQGFKGEYIEQLRAFKEEIAGNAARKEALVEIVGAYDAREVGAALDVYSKDLTESIDEASKLNDCAATYSDFVSDHSDLIQNHEMLARLTEEEREEMVETFKFLGECKAIVAKLKSDEWRFRSITIDLGLHQEAWDAMRRGGTKSFPNRDLGLDLSTIYGRIDVVRKELEEVERELNNGFAKSMSNLQQTKVALAFVLNDHLEDVDTDLEHKSPPPKQRRPIPERAQLDEQVNHYTSLRTTMDTNSDDAFNSWGTIDLKVGRIKTLAAELDGLYTKAQEFIDKEIADTDRGYYPILSNAPKSGSGAKKPPAAPAKKSAVSKAPEPAKKKTNAPAKKGAAPASSK